MRQKGRIIKNIRHKKPVQERKFKFFEFPWDGETSLKILARSRAEAEKVALTLCKNVAASILAEAAPLRKGAKIGRGSHQDPI